MCVCVYVCVLFPFDFEDGIWGLIILVPDLCLSIAWPIVLAVKAKIYELVYNQSSSIGFDETSSY